ncbi:uncharacterized protein LOC112568620 isoform X2 [Pomacea canaliculata]|uniref:uncharacterized protein LOC112568620 isoform X2 n=1 Tax=Pomacea canaliculata TaxID=400727 RepID=UPI000D72F5D9|nr:uncharacterized protein LOC112568620 isoform X2 [Pomacea canaliculata]
MANAKLFVSCALVFVILTMSYSDEQCGDVQFVSPVENTFSTSVNDWLNMTIRINTGKCSNPSFLITLERKKKKDRPTIVCRIHHNQTSCYKTGKEAVYSCRCVSPSGPVEFREKLVTPGDVEYKWRWTDVTSGMGSEKTIIVHVTRGIATGNENYKHAMTDTVFPWAFAGFLLLLLIVFVLFHSRSLKQKSLGINKNVKHFQTAKFILVGVGGLLVVVAVVIFFVSCQSPRSVSGDVKITSPVSNTVNVSVNDWLNMTFTLNTEKCSSPAYVITVENKEQDRPMIMCRIHHNKTSCFTTSNVTTYFCRCVSPRGPVEFWEKLQRPGDEEYRWRWTDVNTGKQHEKKITFIVENRPAAGEENNSHQLPTTINFVLGGLCSLLFIVVAIVFLRLRKRRLSGECHNVTNIHNYGC